MKKVVVILSGCGVFDGVEIYEVVFMLFSLEKYGVSYQCFVLDVDQFYVVNYLIGEVVEGELCNVLVEVVCIVCGNVKFVIECQVDEFDLLVLFGGFGVVKNFCMFVVDGFDCFFNEDVLVVCK